jgi:hypothetical protein
MCVIDDLKARLTACHVNQTVYTLVFASYTLREVDPVPRLKTDLRVVSA